jgi:hypothetical protein
VLHAPPIPVFSILSPARYWVRCTDHSTPHYVIFSIPRYLVSLRPKVIITININFTKKQLKTIKSVNTRARVFSQML